MYRIAVLDGSKHRTLIVLRRVLRFNSVVRKPGISVFRLCPGWTVEIWNRVEQQVVSLPLVRTNIALHNRVEQRD